MSAKDRERIGAGGSPPNAPAAQPAAKQPRGFESAIRRVGAVAALGWLGYVGWLLRECPSSGQICQSSNGVVAAALVALGFVLLGHLLSRVASAFEGWTHAHHHHHQPAH